MPTSAFRSAAAPPALNAPVKALASRSDILRSIVIVTGALADAPPAPLTAAVAVKTSAAVCAWGVAEIISNAADSTVKPIVLYETVIPHLSRVSFRRLEGK